MTMSINTVMATAIITMTVNNHLITMTTTMTVMTMTITIITKTMTIITMTVNNNSNYETAND